MTQLLVSISNLTEARIALENGVGIIDLKHPGRGALGALDIEDIVEIVDFLRLHDMAEGKLITATIGDLPMQPILLAQRIKQLAATEVDVIKVGFFNSDGSSDDIYSACLEELKKLTIQGVKLVAVLFAEYTYPLEMICMIQNAGFYGVMFDTAHKNGATFLDYFSFSQMSEWSDMVRSADMKFGLAGSLQIQHIAQVKQFNPSYIGFRGGLCEGDKRQGALNASRVKAACELL